MLGKKCLQLPKPNKSCSMKEILFLVLECTSVWVVTLGKFNIIFNFFYFFSGEFDGASRWRVCYQWGLHRLVSVLYTPALITASFSQFLNVLTTGYIGFFCCKSWLYSAHWDPDQLSGPVHSQGKTNQK